MEKERDTVTYYLTLFIEDPAQPHSKPFQQTHTHLYVHLHYHKAFNKIRDGWKRHKSKQPACKNFEERSSDHTVKNMDLGGHKHLL